MYTLVVRVDLHSEETEVYQMRSEMKKYHFFYYALGASVIALLAGGCSGGGEEGGPPPGFAAQVVVAEAKVEPVAEKISVVGTLQANEIVSIQSEIDALIEKIGFSEGELVEEGQVLFELDDAKLVATVEQTKANFKLAETILERNRTLLKSRTISQQEFDRAQATYLADGAALELARQNLEDATIHAPFSGIMAERLVSPGQFISRGSVLCTLVDLDPIKAEFNVPERFISQLALNQRIEIRLTAYPGESFEGVVYFIAPRLDTSTRTVLVKAKVSNEDGRLKPGMFGNLDLILKTKEEAIVIPEIAISYNEDQAFVYVVSKEMQAEPRMVEVGLRLAGASEITNGLEAGDLVITEGFQKIGPGAPVAISPKSNLTAKEPEVLEIVEE